MASSKVVYGQDLQIKESECLAYRLVAPKHSKTALSGEGARLYGGRWNSPGMPMVYLASTRSLAALELLVHLPTPDSRLITRVLITVKLPKSCIGGRFWKSEGWDERPPTRLSTDQGDDWLKSGSTVAVHAPSVVIPEENNILLNPRHPDFSKIEIIDQKEFSFDKRL